MDSIAALSSFAALAQGTRLATFQLLVRHEPDGLPAGAIARQLAIPQNTMSSHLSVLAHAELVTQERDGRSIVYRARLDRVRELAVFLVKDCCRGSAAVCDPLVAELSAHCSAQVAVA